MNKIFPEFDDFLDSFAPDLRAQATQEALDGIENVVIPSEMSDEVKPYFSAIVASITVTENYLAAYHLWLSSILQDDQ
jgi:hypothetical protein